MAPLSMLKRLRKLDLYRNRVTKIEGNLQYVEILELGRNLITSVESLRDMPHLTELYLYYN